MPGRYFLERYCITTCLFRFLNPYIFLAVISEKDNPFRHTEIVDNHRLDKRRRSSGITKRQRYAQASPSRPPCAWAIHHVRAYYTRGQKVQVRLCSTGSRWPGGKRATNHIDTDLVFIVSSFTAHTHDRPVSPYRHNSPIKIISLFADVFVYRRTNMCVNSSRRNNQLARVRASVAEISLRLLKRRRINQRRWPPLHMRE